MARVEPTTRQHPAAVLPSTTVDYLRERLRPGALIVLLTIALTYSFAATIAQAWVFVALCVFAACVAGRAPRWVCHGVMAAILLLMVFDFVFTISTGAQDSKSDRDEAVELAATAFLAGSNPWANPTHLGTPITTGPASVLVVLPSVLATGRINALSFVFYLAFFALLLGADLLRRNETFLPLGLFFLSGFLGFQHALYWGLDELAWAYLPLVAGWWLVDARWPMAAGACVAFALCSRSSYAFPVFAMLCWGYYRADRRPDLIRLAAGAGLGAALILAPFVLVCGSDLISHNPFIVAGHKLTSTWPETNPIFRFLNAAAAALGAEVAAIAKTGLALGAIWYGARRAGVRTPAHPFWHMTFAALLANFLVYPAVVSDDYALFFSVPLFLAIAWSPRGFGLAAPIASLPASPAPARARRASPR